MAPETDGEDPPRHDNEIPPGYRMHNGELVPAEQPAITRLMPSSVRRPDPRRRWILAGVALVVVVLVLALVAARPTPVRAPQDEVEFLASVEHAAARVRAGNDVTLVSARMERTREICALLPPNRTVRDWIGTIKDIDTASQDQGVITVSIDAHVDLRTGSGFGADARTLLRPGSDVFESVARLHDGDRVRFGGTFVADRRTCVRETSLFARNGMLTPDFLFLFRTVESAPAR